jgi:hypothetical protein
MVLKTIEPGIRPLVDALNETGLLETFSSCEGHFGEENSTGDFSDRTKAEVRAYVRNGVAEGDVEQLVLHVLSDHMDGNLKWEASLHVWKEYIADPRDDNLTQPLDSFFVFTICPFDPQGSDTLKRHVVDKLITATAASVRQHTLLRRTGTVTPL